MRTLSSAKMWDKYSPSILTPLFSQLILLMMVYCRRGKQFWERYYLPVWLLFKVRIFHYPYAVVELMLPIGIVSQNVQICIINALLALQRVVQILCCQRFFHNDESKAKWNVLLISLLLQLVYYL